MLSLFAKKDDSGASKSLFEVHLCLLWKWVDTCGRVSSGDKLTSLLSAIQFLMAMSGWLFLGLVVHQSPIKKCVRSWRVNGMHRGEHTVKQMMR